MQLREEVGIHYTDHRRYVHIKIGTVCRKGYLYTENMQKTGSFVEIFDSLEGIWYKVIYCESYI
jgi:hypothetical protein